MNQYMLIDICLEINMVLEGDQYGVRGRSIWSYIAICCSMAFELSSLRIHCKDQPAGLIRKWY